MRARGGVALRDLTRSPAKMAGMGTSRLAYLAAGARPRGSGRPRGLLVGQRNRPAAPTFDALVKGFMADDFSGVPFDGDRVTPELVKKQYDEAVAGLGDVKPHVTIASTTHTGGSDAASATLHWTWPIGDGWSYSSKIPLVTHDQGDTWAVPWKVGIIHPSLAAGDTLDATTVGATRADILGPHGVGPDHRAAGGALRGRPAQGRCGPGARFGPAPGAARRHRRRAVRQAGEGGGRRRRSCRRSRSAGTRCRPA